MDKDSTQGFSSGIMAADVEITQKFAIAVPSQQSNNFSNFNTKSATSGAKKLKNCKHYSSLNGHLRPEPKANQSPKDPR